MDKFTINRRIWIVSLVAIIGAVIMGIIFFRQPKTLNDVNLYQILGSPKEFKSQSSDLHCQDYLPTFSDVTEQANWPNLGIPPTEEQLRQESVVVGCIQATIAIYANTNAADKAFQSLYTANKALEAMEIIYNNTNEATIMFATTYKFNFVLPNLGSDIPVKETLAENRLLITKRCNTVVTFYAFIRNNNANPDLAFGMTISDDGIISYAHAIRERIENVICPVVTTYK